MSRPDFFIIGAPKSGTTALSEYLRQHPEILFSIPKEPYFFSDDFIGPIESRDDYLKCFAHGTGSEKAVGEGTAVYLYSRTAVANILQFDSRARFIVMLRNPVEAVYSWHWQVAYAHGKELVDFETAWRAQGKENPLQLSNTCKISNDRIEYGSLFSYADQLVRLFEQVPRERVHIILYDDFAKEPEKIYAETVNFLGLSPFQLASFPRLNANKRPRSRTAWRAIKTGNSLRQKIDIKGFGLFARLDRWNTRYTERPPLAQDFRSELIEYFRSDISRTSEMLGRDLSHWHRG